MMRTARVWRLVIFGSTREATPAQKIDEATELGMMFSRDIRPARFGRALTSRFSTTWQECFSAGTLTHR